MSVVKSDRIKFNKKKNCSLAKSFKIHSQMQDTPRPEESAQDVQNYHSYNENSIFDQEGEVHFDETAILDRYHRLHHQQYRQLTTLNLSQPLMHKLWGFQPGTLVENQYKNNSMVIQTHPVKGRVIMSHEKYLSKARTKKREMNIRSSAFDRNEENSQDPSTIKRLANSSKISGHMFNPEIHENSEGDQSQTRLIQEEMEAS